jgi:uncharacterized protein YndB with AHSA1/START domain
LSGLYVSQVYDQEADVTSKLQGSSEIVIDAPADAVWAVLEDSRANLPRLWPMVKSCEIDGKERVGAMRRCGVEFMGKDGYTVERCIESVPNRRLAHSIEDDSFGFSRMLSDFWFAFILEPQTAETTRVRVETHFEPKGLRARLMSKLMMRRKFGEIRETALANLKRVAENSSRAQELASSPLGAESTAAR